MHFLARANKVELPGELRNPSLQLGWYCNLCPLCRFAVLRFSLRQLGLRHVTKATDQGGL